MFKNTLKIARIKNRSMLPTLSNGDLVLATKLKHPKIGGIVFIKNPNNPKTLMVKRLLGLEGDELKLQNGLLIRNGIRVNESYLFGDSMFSEEKEFCWSIKPNHCLVLSDNRLAEYNSIDSRNFGQISVELIVACVIVKLYPTLQKIEVAN